MNNWQQSCRTRSRNLRRSGTHGSSIIGRKPKRLFVLTVTGLSFSFRSRLWGVGPFLLSLQSFPYSPFPTSHPLTLHPQPPLFSFLLLLVSGFPEHNIIWLLAPSVWDTAGHVTARAFSGPSAPYQRPNTIVHDLSDEEHTLLLPFFGGTGENFGPCCLICILL